MANEAESAQIFEVAFAAAFDHGQDVIGIPEAFPGDGFESPTDEEPGAVGAA